MRSLYLDCLRAVLRSDLDTVSSCLSDTNWDWEKLFALANHHAVLPSVSSLLLNSPGMFACAEARSIESAFFSTVLSLNRERNTAILDELKAVARLLNAIGIKPILLKGAAYLATGVYSDPASRYLIDIDLLVPASEIAAAAEVLVVNGFAPDQSDKFARFRHHHPPLRRQQSISVELHHRLGMGPCEFLLPAAKVIEHSLELDLEDVSVRVPNPQHLVTHLIIHSQMQHPYHERIWLPLRAAYDLVMLDRRFGRDIDWPAIEKDFAASGRRGLLHLHLLDLREYLGLESPMPSKLPALVYLRWLRRKLLRQVPVLRYCDPLYMFSSICIRRLRLLVNILREPRGPAYLAVQMLRPPIYGRLLSDIMHGRGRS